MTIKRML